MIIENLAFSTTSFFSDMAKVYPLMCNNARWHKSTSSWDLYELFFPSGGCDFLVNNSFLVIKWFGFFIVTSCDQWFWVFCDLFQCFLFFYNVLCECLFCICRGTTQIRYTFQAQRNPWILMWRRREDSHSTRWRGKKVSGCGYLLNMSFVHSLAFLKESRKMGMELVKLSMHGRISQHFY